MLLHVNTRPTMKWRAQALRVVGASALGLACTLASAASVSYQATDLADVVAGQDLWQLAYTVKGPIDTFEAVNILFAPDRFASLNLVSNTPPGGLDVLLTQPDAQLGTDGQLNLSAFRPLPDSFEGLVTVRFVWLGQAAPGAQTYEWLDADFNVKAQGLTQITSAVPESHSLPLAIVGAGVMWALMARRAARPLAQASGLRPALQTRSDA